MAKQIIFTVTKAGNTFGENEHILTIEEMASHKHGLGGLRERTVKTATSNLGTDNYTNTNLIVRSTVDNDELFVPAGGDQPHNNIQPSIVAAYWLRTT